MAGRVAKLKEYNCIIKAVGVTPSVSIVIKIIFREPGNGKKSRASAMWNIGRNILKVYCKERTSVNIYRSGTRGTELSGSD